MIEGANQLVPDPVTSGRVWRATLDSLYRSDDGGDHSTEITGGPGNLGRLIIGNDGRAVVFDLAQQVWAVSEPDAWELVGTTPGVVDGASTTACPEGLAIGPTSTSAALYLTESYGH